MVDYEWLKTQGLIDSEAKELADSSYNLPDYEHISYLHRMLAQRKRYINIMKRRGFTDKEISARILKNIYEKRNYNTVWDLIRHYRKIAIADGGYDYKPRKKSGKLDREAIARQKRNRQSKLSQYEQKRGKGW